MHGAIANWKLVGVPVPPPESEAVAVGSRRAKFGMQALVDQVKIREDAVVCNKAVCLALGVLLDGTR